MTAFNTIIQKYFGLAPDRQLPELTAQNIPQWDSMNYLLVISDLEKEYGVSFTMDEVLSAKSLGNLQSFLRNKGISL